MVIDTSALLEVLVSDTADPELVRRVAHAAELHAPHLIDVELLSALRGLVRGGKLSPDRATDVRQEALSMKLIRYPLAGIADRIWALRDAMTCYDACYIALAESLDFPLVTTDARLGRSTGHAAAVEVYPATSG